MSIVNCLNPKLEREKVEFSSREVEFSSREILEFSSREKLEFSFDGFKTTARLFDVHDGDTVTVLADVGPFFDSPRPFETLLTLRLVGIDAPEMTSHDAETKRKAEAARCRIVEILAPDLYDLIPKVNVHENIHENVHEHLTRIQMRDLLNKRDVSVFVSCGGYDKYGRTLAEVSSSDGAPTVNSILLGEKMVNGYDGRRKVP